APLFVQGATIADSWRAAAKIYSAMTLPVVTDLEAFHAAYLPGRSPNASRMAHPQESDDPSQQTQAGSDQKSDQRGEGGEETEARQNAESGDQRDDGEKKERPSYGD